MLTTLAGAMMAVRQDDMKRMLAYSSMSQLGYIVTAIALMSHLGWVTALYLVANHLMVKGILFLAAAGDHPAHRHAQLRRPRGPAQAHAVHLRRCCRRDRRDVGPAAADGLRRQVAAAQRDDGKGWYGPAVDRRWSRPSSAFSTWSASSGGLSSAHAKPAHARSREAPLALLVPQYLLVVGILVLSFFPKLLMEPVSAAIDPQFASTLVWQGMSLEMIYGYWNPVPVMRFAVAAAAILYGLFWLLRATGWPKSSRSLAAQYLRYLQAGLHDTDPVMGERFLGCARRCCWRARRPDEAALHRQRPDLQPVHPLLLPRPVHGGWRPSSPMTGTCELASFSILRDPKKYYGCQSLRDPLHQTCCSRTSRSTDDCLPIFAALALRNASAERRPSSRNMHRKSHSAFNLEDAPSVARSGLAIR